MHAAIKGKKALKEENVSEENPVGNFSFCTLRQRERGWRARTTRERKCRKERKKVCKRENATEIIVPCFQIALFGVGMRTCIT